MSMSNSPFLNILAAEVERSRENFHLDNYDVSQLGPYRADKHREDLVGPRSAATMAAPPADPAAPELAARELGERMAAFADVGLLHGLLADEPSRDLLVKLFAFRTLGYRRIKLPRNTTRYWDDIQAVRGAAASAPPIPIAFMDLRLGLYDLRPFGYGLRVYATPPGLACVYVQKQYEYRRAGVTVCKAEPGDIAIDAGACWGETSVYFAHEVGAHGRVLAFEFIPSNLAVLRRNLEVNPELARRIDVVENPLWSSSGSALYYVDWGPGSRVSADAARFPGANRCMTVSIDEAVGARRLPRVDFIKMDIEGAELPALKGAERSLRAHRPKLAISLYHQLSDFVTIPRYLESLSLGYDYYLDHHTIYLNETVLFAVPRR
jgi:FkbM family methyltransferase